MKTKVDTITNIEFDRKELVEAFSDYIYKKAELKIDLKDFNIYIVDKYLQETCFGFDNKIEFEKKVEDKF